MIKEEWTVLSMLEWGTQYFSGKQVNQPRLSIEWLLSHILDCPRLDLYLAFNRPLTRTELDRLRELVRRRAVHEPLQYITGSTDFHTCHIKVNPSVLIPRPETEQLVEIILGKEAGRSPCRVLDIGTGSGCIAIALKKAQPGWNITGIDISREALETARQNALINRVEVTFTPGDLLDISLPALHGDFDIIVSNPPYITWEERDGLDIEVRDYEPTAALFHENIDTVYSSIRVIAEKRLRTQGVLYVELSEFIGPDTLKLFDEPQWDATLLQDYSHKPRFIHARLKI